MSHKDTLIDLLIHDLTGPISVVLTSTNNLLKKEAKYGPYNDYQKEALSRVLRNARKAKVLIEEMVEVLKSEEGAFRKGQISVGTLVYEVLRDALEMTRPDVAELIAGAEGEGELAKILNQHGIFVELSGKYAWSLFCHDERKMRQIILNLATNALKYGGDRVVLSVSGEDELFLSIEDNGAGISEKEQEGAFGRFRELHSGKDKGAQPGGFGFGLSCVKKLVEAMKGTITLSSLEGAGTCFTVRIPPL